MKVDPNVDTTMLLHRLGGVSECLFALAEFNHNTQAALYLLSEVTETLANALLERFDPEGTK